MPSTLLKVKSFLGLGTSDNGANPVMSPKVVAPLYREWVPKELPGKYADWTPTWLYYKLHYEVAAQKVFGLKANNAHQVVKLGLTIAAIGILLVFGIVVMSYAAGGK